jgi:zinc transporter
MEWIDLDLTHDKDVRWLRAQSGLEEGVIELIFERSKGTLRQQFAQGTYLSVLVTKLGEDASQDHSIGVGIWADPHRFITLRWGPRGEILQGLAKAIEAGEGPDSPCKALAYIASRAPRLVEQNLARLASTVDELEDRMLDRDQALPIDRLASLRRRLIYMRRYKAPLASMIDSIANDPKLDIDDDTLLELQGAAHQMRQQQELLEFYIDRAAVIQEQIESQLNDRMNNAMYRLTLVATVFLPLSFLTGLLGINVAGLPGTHNPFAFWLVCLFLVIVAIVSIVLVAKMTRR